MILRPPRPHLPSPFKFHPLPPRPPHALHARPLHASLPPRRTPPPTPFVPNASTFLTLIGRNLSAHAAKIPTWDALFSLTSPQLRELGVEPARTRRYLLQWRDRFRRGVFGIGGDLTDVTDGVAELRVVEVPGSATATSAPGKKKIVVNVPLGAAAPEEGNLQAVKGVRLRGAHAIYGPYVTQIKGTLGSAARIAVTEGMWEMRRGHKVDGGERRKAEVRAKRRAAERKNSK